MSGALAGATAVALGGTLAATAASGAKQRVRHLDAKAAQTTTSKAPTGAVFGGVTPQGWPMVVELNKTGKQVKRAVIGVDMTCTSGASFGTADGFSGMLLSNTGRFKATFGPERVDAGGVPADVSSSMVGRVNKARTSMRGTWNLKVVVYDATGANVVDTCESGPVAWKALQ